MGPQAPQLLAGPSLTFGERIRAEPSLPSGGAVAAAGKLGLARDHPRATIHCSTPMAIAFVIFWAVLGVAVFLVALRGGPRGARGALHTESRTARRVVLGAFLGITALGVIVPALVLARNGDHHAAISPGGLSLNAEQQRGRNLFAATCSTCHTLRGANAVGRVGPNLDILRPPASLVLNAIADGRARGMGQMPALLYQGRDAEAVASYVVAVAGH